MRIVQHLHRFVLIDYQIVTNELFNKWGKFLIDMREFKVVGFLIMFDLIAFCRKYFS